MFDGPNKPAFKRNKRSSGRNGDFVATAMAKRLIRLFGFAMHDAPGEAEAECALLQQQGVVDAVLSEDVDTIMFGCRKTLRNWSAEGQKGPKTPTHVSMYDAAAVAAGTSGLDREGMVLVALMSGGDYLPEGVPGCGVKVACEAARAGFGRDLCRIKKADGDGLVAWRARLLHELRTNEAGFFRTRHKALDIPESFPNMEILRYYTHPVVSREATVDRLKREFPPSSTTDVVGLREFTRETFDWTFRIGAVKLIRVLAPNLLVQRFLERFVSPKPDDLGLKQKHESALVKAISSKRVHFSTDATPELRISFVPTDIVKLDLDAEPEEQVEAYGRSGIALNSDDEFEEAVEEVDSEQPKSSSAGKQFDPFQPDLVWIPETVAKLGIPLTVEDWEGKQRTRAQRVTVKGSRKTRATKTDMPVGALDKYVKVTKSAVESTAKDSLGPRLDLSPPRISSQCHPPAPKGRSKQSKKTSTSSQAKPSANINPWTLANSQASPRAAKSRPPPPSQAQPKPSSAREPILLSSSPVVPASPAAHGTGVTHVEMTPTKTKRPGPLPGDIPSPAPLFSTTPSPRKQRLPASEEPVEEPTAAPSARTSRPFERVKSGAEGTATIPTTQQSIRAFGRVGKPANPSTATTKPDVFATLPIEILSDDDDDFPPPPLPATSAPKTFSQSTSAPRNDSFDIANDDDPFASPPPAHRAPPSRRPPIPAAVPISPTKGKLGQQQKSPDIHDWETTKTDTTTSTTTTATAVPAKPASAAAAAAATTKLYVPRTSLNGLGYFSQVEVGRDEADEVLAAHNAPPAPRLEKGKNSRPSRRAWRLSELEVLDLTGED